ncbi:tRNA 2-thiouridine synthesizing protein B [Providencia rustigianii]|uniref:Sulfur relay protein TusB/DsrH n=2 Tax=Providencia rustigianii TaxID=158850 RepID=D1P0H0_9GAMM|nr:MULTISPECIES: sulfurtransferase complex subunit TusB [Providencia]EFB72839.1 sulfur relay protein TusB/DsrH [Providencia rustigianii DSM 4541]MTC56298.1 sulfurtransferase complex subunit TusB [Providencia rustigianii]MTC59000.1 sulfurtransferase complex subunit TusB [Providencia rustigianii]SPY76273.1 tRNA 2-thiouridine synthesizing protein B [Providencia rustigianii]SUC25455.1 tRNA 2-thiouridine synthesizing protein B [Providencia rustigianii]
MLYTIATSPFKCDFPAILRLITNNDAVLLMQDGVVAAIAHSKYLAELQNSGAQIYALDVDINARGLQKKISDNVSIITYQGFVTLTEAHKQHFAL